MSVRGFTFIEVLIAISILSFGILFVFRAFFTSVSGIRYINEKITASMILNEAEWNARKLLYQNFFVGSYNESKAAEDNEKYNVDISLNKKPDCETLYDLNSAVKWESGSRSFSFKREIYIRKLV
ncbi:MAG: type II secretion system protein [Candidatus Omnitrophica bacterium]|nr:type II secretion system protein [Candidatus Omnitrophota bacterium]